MTRAVRSCARCCRTATRVPVATQRGVTRRLTTGTTRGMTPFDMLGATSICSAQTHTWHRRLGDAVAPNKCGRLQVNNRQWRLPVIQWHPPQAHTSPTAGCQAAVGEYNERLGPGAIQLHRQPRHTTCGFARVTVPYP